MQQIIEDVAKVHIGSISSAVKDNLKETMEDLNFMFEKTALPRPIDLGKSKPVNTSLKRNSPDF